MIRSIVIIVGIMIGYIIARPIFNSAKRKWDYEQQTRYQIVVVDKRTGHDMIITAANHSTIQHYHKCEKCKK